jgi:hypothetical protein
MKILCLDPISYDKCKVTGPKSLFMNAGTILFLQYPCLYLMKVRLVGGETFSSGRLEIRHKVSPLISH